MIRWLLPRCGALAVFCLSLSAVADDQALVTPAAPAFSFSRADYLDIIRPPECPRGLILISEASLSRLEVDPASGPYSELSGMTKAVYFAINGQTPALGADGSFNQRIPISQGPSFITFDIGNDKQSALECKWALIWKKTLPLPETAVQAKTQVSTQYDKGEFIQLFDGSQAASTISAAPSERSGLRFRFFAPPMPTGTSDSWHFILQDPFGQTVVEKGGNGSPPEFVDWMELKPEVEPETTYSYRLDLVWAGKTIPGPTGNFMVRRDYRSKLAVELGLGATASSYNAYDRSNQSSANFGSSLSPRAGLGFGLRDPSSSWEPRLGVGMDFLNFTRPAGKSLDKTDIPLFGAELGARYHFTPRLWAGGSLLYQQNVFSRAETPAVLTWDAVFTPGVLLMGSYAFYESVTFRGAIEVSTWDYLPTKTATYTVNNGLGLGADLKGGYQPSSFPFRFVGKVAYARQWQGTTLVDQGFNQFSFLLGLEKDFGPF